MWSSRIGFGVSLGAHGYVSMQRSFKGPHLQVLDGKVMFGRQWPVVEGGAFGREAMVKASVQPQAQTTPSSTNLKGICVSFHKV